MSRVRLGVVLVAGTSLFWAGLVTGLALLAAPVKFTVPDLPERMALQVGQAQFGTLYTGEVILAALLLVGLVLWRPPRAVLLAAGLLLMLYLVQRLVILPPLTERTTLRIAGDSVGESSLHVWYIAFDVLKTAVLLLTGGLALWLAAGRGRWPEG